MTTQNDSEKQSSADWIKIEITKAELSAVNSMFISLRYAIIEATSFHDLIVEVDCHKNSQTGEVEYRLIIVTYYNKIVVAKCNNVESICKQGEYFSKLFKMVKHLASEYHAQEGYLDPFYQSISRWGFYNLYSV